VHAQGSEARGELLFQSDREGPTRLFILDVATGAQRRVGSAGDWFDEDPVWSPDGARIAFASTRFQRGNIDIYVMNADGSSPVRLTDDPAPDQDPAWAADGRSVFFTSERDGRGEIYRVWLDSRKVDRLTAGLDRAIMPATSPDGRYLAYAAQTLIAFQIKLVDLRTGERRDVGTRGGACRPAFAPDSQELAFVLMDPEPSKIETATESSRRTLWSDPKTWAYYPAYSPDGRFVAFSVSPAHHRGEDWDLALVDRTRPGSFRKLTSGRGNDRAPQWRPIGPSWRG
jgi:TolB protein